MERPSSAEALAVCLSALETGRPIADVAKDQGLSVDAVRSAVRSMVEFMRARGAKIPDVKPVGPAS